MSAGMSLSEELRAAVNRCDACVFIATRRSIESQWCLAELGAFWGAGKRVILYVADSDLEESVLPPQLRGQLRADNGESLLRAIAAAHDDQARAAPAQYEFFHRSVDFGDDRKWRAIFEEAQTNFDILGVSLTLWRKDEGFRQAALRKAEQGCHIRILHMHAQNKFLGALVHKDSALPSVLSDIADSAEYYGALSKEHQNIEARQITRDLPHLAITRTERRAVRGQYLASQSWSKGPAWACLAPSEFFGILTREFDHLWRRASGSSSAVLQSAG